MKNILYGKTGLVLILCVILSFSCGGKVTTRTPTGEFKFTVKGVLVKDLNLDKDVVFFTILRDSVPFDSAVVKIGADTLPNQGNGIYYKEAQKLFDFGQSVSIHIGSAGDDFRLTASVVIPDSFYIEELPANDTLNVGGHSVKVSWTPSAQASGYFMSVVNPDTSPGLVGYTTLDENNDRAETILPSAFITSQDVFIEGMYEIYVVAYHGSFVEYPDMAFELPQGLPANNITGASGTIGAGVVAEKKLMRVVEGE